MTCPLILSRYMSLLTFISYSIFRRIPTCFSSAKIIFFYNWANIASFFVNGWGTGGTGGQAPFTGWCYRERQPVPSVHLQHFDIVPRLMPVMRDGCRTPAPGSFIILHISFLLPISSRWNSAMLWHWERQSISWRTLSSVWTVILRMSAGGWCLASWHDRLLCLTVCVLAVALFPIMN